MRIARAAIDRPLYTWLLMLFCLVGGIGGYLAVGKLEDPGITLKSALVVTHWPGATASEVATQLSEVLESELQRMEEIDYLTSRNTPGLSVIEVHVRDTFAGRQLPQIWDKLRARVADAAPRLPAGAQTPQINDSFGDIFGIYFAVTAPGFSDAEIHEIARHLRRAGLAVRGVGDAELRGLPEEAVFVEPDPATLANLGVPPMEILAAIGAVAGVDPAGTVRDGGARLRLEAPQQDAVSFALDGLTVGSEGHIFSLADLAEIRRDRVDDPGHMMRHDGVEAFTLGISALDTANIVTVGARVEAALEAAMANLPLGIGLHAIYQQHVVVDEANNAFLVSLAMSVAVVISVLALSMGWRAAAVVGATLALTVLATFFFMFVFAIKIERISLGALIIAMGMLVDNAIVMAEGMQTEMAKGRPAAAAAQETARKTQVPLLGATVIGAMAFAGIGLSPDASGEFLFSLFAVITISLLLSWLLAVTVTPYLASQMFQVGVTGAADPYDRPLFRAYGRLVRGALQVRGLVILGLIGATVAGFGAMGFVTQQFFPPAQTPLFYFNYHGQQGGSIQQTSNDLHAIENWLAERADVVAVTATMGEGASRFMLTYTPAKPDPAHGQLIIRAAGVDAIPGLRQDLETFAKQALPWAETRVEQVIYGPPVGADVEVRLSGPDPDTLRRLADEARTVLEGTDLLQGQRIDWRERGFTIRPRYADDRAKSLGVTRADVAAALALATDGTRAGVIREGERTIPILLRSPRGAFGGDGRVLDQIVYAPAAGEHVPLAQVTDGFDVQVRDIAIQRRDRMPTISVQGFSVPGVLADQAFAEVRAALEGIDLPPGYRFEWGGEYESAGKAQQSLGRQMPLAFGTMLLITVLLFGKLRQTAVVWTVVPMAVNGAAIGLLLAGRPFSFTALLGLLSLSGMLIKNAIVLVEEIDAQKREAGLPQSEAIIAASVSRLRPVVLAAGTTILGIAPLVVDPFFASMAVTIMAGLAGASILTLIGVPVLYHTYLRAERHAEGQRNGTVRVSSPQGSPHTRPAR